MRATTFTLLLFFACLSAPAIARDAVQHDPCEASHDAAVSVAIRDAARKRCMEAIRTSNVIRLYQTRYSGQDLQFVSALDVNEWAAAKLTAYAIGAAKDPEERAKLLADALDALHKALMGVGDDRACHAVIENNLGTARFWMKQYSDAVAHYEKALDLVQRIQAEPSSARPSPPPQWDPADHLYSCHTHDFNEAVLRARLGAVYIRIDPNRGCVRAMQQYDSIVAMGADQASAPEPLNLLADIAREYSRKNELESARQPAERLLAAAGDHNPEYVVVAHRILGAADQRTNDHGRAADHFRAALQISTTPSKERSELHRQLARSLLALGDVSGAMNAYQRALDEAVNDDDRASTLFARGFARVGIRDESALRAGIADLRAVRETAFIPARNAYALRHEALALAQLKEWDPAIARYAELLEFLGKHPDVLQLRFEPLRDLRVELAAAEEGRGNRSDAVATLRLALQTPGTLPDSDIYCRIALLHFPDDLRASQEALNKAMLAVPRTPLFERKMHAALAAALLEAKPSDLVGAAREADLALQIGYPDKTDREYVAVLKNSAYALVQLKNYPPAFERYAELLSIAPREQHDDLLERQGGIYEGMSPPDRDSALRIYERIQNKARRHERMKNIYMAKAKDAFCASQFDEAARWYEAMRASAVRSQDAASAAAALKLIADMHFANLLLDYVQTGTEIPPPSPAQLARLKSLDAEFAAVIANPALDPKARRHALTRRGDLAHFSFDFDWAERYYTNPLLTSVERAIVAPRLEEIARIRAADGVLPMKRVRDYADFSDCP